jgi:hypothetical protein
MAEVIKYRAKTKQGSVKLVWMLVIGVEGDGGVSRVVTKSRL